MPDLSGAEVNKLDAELEAIFQKKPPRAPSVPPRKLIPTVRKQLDQVSRLYNESAFAKAVIGTGTHGEQATWAEKDVAIPVQDGSASIPGRIYTPHSVPADGAPVIMVFHGSGWFLGSLETEALICRAFAARHGAVVVNVNYRHYPDVDFPVPTQDVFEAVKWVSQTAASFDGNLKKGFVLYANSGGCTFAAIALYMYQAAKLSSPAITGCFWSCPIFPVEGLQEQQPALEFPSIKRHANAPLMNQKMQEGIRGLANYDFRSKLFSQYNWSDHTNLPRTYVLVCGLDPWRDPGAYYADLISKADPGNETRLKVYNGLPHCWWSTFPQIKASQRWANDTIQAMGWLLKANAKDGKTTQPRL